MYFRAGLWGLRREISKGKTHNTVGGDVEINPSVNFQVAEVVFVIFVPNLLGVEEGVLWYVKVRPVRPGIVLFPTVLYSPTVVSPTVNELRLSGPIVVELTCWDDGTRFWFLD